MKIISNNNKWFLVDDSKDELILTPLNENKVYKLNKTSESVRTWKANRALHKYLGLVAEALNDAGYSVQYVLNRKRDVKIEKVMTWLHSILKDDRVIQVKDKILSHADAQISWTTENVKNLLWRTFQNALTSKESTTEISSKDIDIIYKELDKYLTVNYGIESIDFPSEESMQFNKQLKDQQWKRK